MNARYQNDTARGMGFGILHISELPALSSTLTFSLQRSRDSRFLGVTGWQDAEEQLTPDSVVAQGGNQFQLGISPAVVEHLEELETYRCTVYGEGLHERCVLELSGVIYAPSAGSGMLEQAKMPVKPVKAVEAPPAPQPQPEPEPEPLPAPEPLPELNNAPAKKKSKAPLFLALALIVALAAGGGAWYYVQSQKAAAEQAQKEAVAQAEADKLAQEKAAEEKAAQEKAEQEKAAAEKKAAEEKAVKEAEEKAAAEKAAAEQALKKAEAQAAEEKAAAEKAAAELAAKVSAKTRVHTFMQGNATPADALKLSQELAAESAEDQDARFLLFEMAAQGGLAPAMLEVARYYNPADTQPAGTIIKDPEQALFWLQKAEALPESAAAASAAKTSLRQWAEREVQAGNGVAQALLERMK